MVQSPFTYRMFLLSCLTPTISIFPKRKSRLTILPLSSSDTAPAIYKEFFLPNRSHREEETTHSRELIASLPLSRFLRSLDMTIPSVLAFRNPASKTFSGKRKSSLRDSTEMSLWLAIRIPRPDPQSTSEACQPSNQKKQHMILGSRCVLR